MSLDQRLMAVRVTPGPALEASAPAALFEVRGYGAYPVRSLYAVSADGRRFLMPLPSRSATPSPIEVIINWTAR